MPSVLEKKEIVKKIANKEKQIEALNEAILRELSPKDITLPNSKRKSHSNCSMTTKQMLELVRRLELQVKHLKQQLAGTGTVSIHFRRR